MELLVVFGIGVCANAGVASTAAKAAAVKVRFIMKFLLMRLSEIQREWPAAFASPLKRKRGT
jgi:hypothetical protein